MRSQGNRAQAMLWAGSKKTQPVTYLKELITHHYTEKRFFKEVHDSELSTEL